MRDEFIVHIHPLKAYYFWDKSILGWLRVSEWVSEEIWERYEVFFSPANRFDNFILNLSETHIL